MIKNYGFKIIFPFAPLARIFSVVSGIYLSVEMDLPSGPSIVAVSSILFFVSHMFGLIAKNE